MEKLDDRARGVCPSGRAILSDRDDDSRAARAHRPEVILTFPHGCAALELRQRHQVSFTEDGPMVLIASRGPSASQTVHARRWIDSEKMYGLHNLRSLPRAFLASRGASDRFGCRGSDALGSSGFQTLHRGIARGHLGLSGGPIPTSNDHGVGLQRVPRAARNELQNTIPPGGIRAY